MSSLSRCDEYCTEPVSFTVREWRHIARYKPPGRQYSPWGRPVYDMRGDPAEIRAWRDNHARRLADLERDGGW